MNWMDKLERKIGRYAVPNLMLYIIIMYGAGYVLYLINPAFYAQYLCLNAQAILHGQVWRIITFIIQPPSYSLIWMLVALSLYYFIGKELERAWGTFRFNLYFFAGVLFHVIAAILVYVLTGLVLPLGTGYEHVVIPCICSYESECTVHAIFHHSGESQMAGVAGRSIFYLGSYPGISPGVWRKCLWNIL